VWAIVSRSGLISFVDVARRGGVDAIPATQLAQSERYRRSQAGSLCARAGRASERAPDRPKQFVFATARNFLIDKVRRERIVPIEAAGFQP